MSKVPSLNYDKVVKALQRDGWVIVRQKGSHIRLQKHVGNEVLKIIVPAHKPVKRSTLSHILKQARLSVDNFSKNYSFTRYNQELGDILYTQVAL
jgi:predicted RNA binding protein YcfA (HicA-like mRNA interferase family)